MTRDELERGVALLAAVDTPWEPLTAQRRYDAVLATWLYKHRTDLIASARQAQDNAKDAERVEWMERYLCRAGEVKDNDTHQTVKLCRVWSIMGELETLRETVDAAIAAATPGKGEG